MSEQKLVDLGAECVTGDLILDGKTVGRYRDEAFTMTSDGLQVCQAAAEVGTDAPDALEPKPRRRSKVVEAPPPVVEATPPPAETMAGLDLSDLDAVRAP